MAAFVRPTMNSVRAMPGGLPAWGAGGAGVLTALGVAVAPSSWLAWAGATLGVADLVDQTVSVGLRAGLALATGSVAAAVGWAALYLLWGPDGLLERRSRPVGTPAVRRADAHPDAPPRRPLTAAELVDLAGDRPSFLPAIGPAAAAAPLSVAPARQPAERPVPADLDTPLAALDPAAIPATALEPIRALTPLAVGERLETFPLARPARPAATPAESPSIEALLRRLEAGAERRVARAG